MHQPELGAEPDAALQMRFEQGDEVGALARTYFPGGVLIDEDEHHLKEAIQKTQDALREGVPAIFEATFAYDDVLVRVDILEKTDAGWHIVEVKSSTGVADTHLDDIAVQRHVLEGCGLKIDKTFLMRVNRECVFPDMSDFFLKEDVSARVQEKMPDVAGNLKKQKAALGLKEHPQIDIGPYCDEPYTCEFKPYCWRHIGKNTVFDLYGFGPVKEFEYYRAGIVDLKDLPEDFSATQRQAIQLKATRTRKPFIDKKGLGEFLDGIQYPVYYLDFETANPAIPLFDGLHPYDRIPFQFSCHKRDKEDGIMHVEFISLENKDPRRSFIEALLKAVDAPGGSQGSVVVYSSFEKGVINHLAEAFSEYKNALLSIVDRLMDLKKVVFNYYYHPDFWVPRALRRCSPRSCRV